MSRQARIVIPGVAHHVTQRGNYRQDIFFVDNNRRLYLHYLKESATLSGLRIDTYCLMTNHVHLVATPGTEMELARGSFLAEPLLFMPARRRARAQRDDLCRTEPRPRADADLRLNVPLVQRGGPLLTPTKQRGAAFPTPAPGGDPQRLAGAAEGHWAEQRYSGAHAHQYAHRPPRTTIRNNQRSPRPRCVLERRTSCSNASEKPVGRQNARENKDFG